MKKNYSIVICVLLLFAGVTLKAQKVRYNGTEYAVEADTIVLDIPQTRGDIQWQKSKDLAEWTNIPGAFDDSVVVSSAQSYYYRARIIEGDCDPVYSSFITVMNPGSELEAVLNRNTKVFTETEWENIMVAVTEDYTFTLNENTKNRQSGSGQWNF